MSLHQLTGQRFVHADLWGHIYIYIYSLARAVENDIQSVLLLLADPWQEETLKISMNVSFMTDHAVSATEKSRWHTLHISRPMTLTDIIKRACACQNSQWLALTTKHNSFKYSTRMLAWLNNCCQLRRPDHNDHSLRWPAHSQTVTVWQSDKVFKQGLTSSRAACKQCHPSPRQLNPSASRKERFKYVSTY